jgi:hypothetical protein
MKPERLQRILAEVQERTTKLLATKSSEYSRKADVFHNFRQAGRRLDCHPIRALIGMKEKHTTYLYDMVKDLESGKLPTKHILDEKFFDEINYLILEYAMFRELITDYQPEFTVGNLEYSHILPDEYTWHEAMNLGKDGWRLPTKDELVALYAQELKSHGMNRLWSASLDAWLFSFDDSTGSVRLVREVSE